MTAYPSPEDAGPIVRRQVVIQPGIKPRSVVMPLALRCSALDRCAIREPEPLAQLTLAS